MQSSIDYKFKLKLNLIQCNQVVNPSMAAHLTYLLVETRREDYYIFIYIL